MVNIITSIVDPLVSALLSLYGLKQHTVETTPGTTIHIWAPKTTLSENDSDRKRSKDEKMKPAVVLIHGFAGTGAMTWLPQVAALAGEYAVYVPDLLFFGGSTTDAGAPWGMGFQGEVLGKALRLLGVHRCAVVGCSYGGGVGAKMAEADPELVGCLVLSNSNVAMTESHSEGVFGRVGVESWSELMLPDSVGGLKRLLGAVVFSRPWFPDWAYSHYLEVMFDHRKERAELIKAAVINDDDFYVPNFSQKVYFLSGEKDMIFDIELVRNTKMLLGDKATLHCIEKAGHLVHLERPLIYNRLLKKILEPYKAHN